MRCHQIEQGTMIFKTFLCERVNHLGWPSTHDRNVQFLLIVFFFSNDLTVWASSRYSVETMEAVPADLQPPQLIYIMLMCLRALAVQSGVFVSPTDMCWEQANPNGAHGPVGCTVGDGSNLGSALGCTEVSDSDSSQKETKAEGVGKTQGPETEKIPREPPFPPPRRRQRSSSSNDDRPWKKKGKKWSTNNRSQKFPLVVYTKKKKWSIEAMCDTMETLTSRGFLVAAPLWW